VACLEPISGCADDADGRLARLLRDGLITPRRSDPLPTLFSSDPPPIREGRSGVDALIEFMREFERKRG